MTSEYMCDFETTTDPEDCRVWAAGACDIDTLEVVHLSTNIDDFMEWVQGFKRAKLFFHNLRFDGEFILSWLFRNGFSFYESDKKMPCRTFNTLISDMGQFYKMTIRFDGEGKKKKQVEIFDSLKRLPFKVAKIGKDFGLAVSKGEIDYTAVRPFGYEPTAEEWDYLRRDCRIVAEAIKMQLNEGMKKMTTAANALAYYKELMGNQFDYWFPVLPKAVDDDIRKAYKGGYVYLKPEHRNKMIGEGIVFDYNSHFPARMYEELMPFGYPVYFEGQYTPHERYPLYIQRLRCAFRLKPGHLPCVQIKKGIFQESEYLEASEVEIDGRMELVEVDLTLTSVDLELFLQQYDIVGEIEWRCGFMFQGQRGMFKEYIDHWMHIKETSPRNSAQRAISKLYLNSLYGKFASTTERMQKTPYMCPDGVVRYYTYYEPARDRKGNLIFDTPSKLRFKRDREGNLVERKPEIVDAVYTPVSAFITAWARYRIIQHAQSVYDRFIYCDSDSLHLIGTDVPEELDVHETRLGALKCEATFTKAKFLRAKTYMETIDGKDHVTCAGMPDYVKKTVTYDTFTPGAKFPGKLLPTRVPGGVVLQPVDFTIKL